MSQIKINSKAMTLALALGFLSAMFCSRATASVQPIVGSIDFGGSVTLSRYHQFGPPPHMLAIARKSSEFGAILWLIEPLPDHPFARASKFGRAACLLRFLTSVEGSNLPAMLPGFVDVVLLVRRIMFLLISPRVRGVVGRHMRPLYLELLRPFRRGMNSVSRT